jgi:hypothetical protein
MRRACSKIRKVVDRPEELFELTVHYQEYKARILQEYFFGIKERNQRAYLKVLASWPRTQVLGRFSLSAVCT